MKRIFVSRLFISFFPMQNIKYIDNQLVTNGVVEMWYTEFVKNFCVAVKICIIEMHLCRFRETLPLNNLD